MFAGLLLPSQISGTGSSATAQESYRAVKGQPHSFCRSVCVRSFVCNAFTSWGRDEARVHPVVLGSACGIAGLAMEQGSGAVAST